jgi:hypothetical protein
LQKCVQTSLTQYSVPPIWGIQLSHCHCHTFKELQPNKTLIKKPS